MEVEYLIAKKYTGQPIERLEDLKLLTGLGGFADDIDFAHQHYAAILRSPYAHAKIKSIDVSKALSHSAVIYVLTGEEVTKLTKPMASRAAPKSPTSHYIIAHKKVRYHGEPVVAVVAKDKYSAYDALELIEVEYEPLPVVMSIDEALKPDAPLIYEELGTNVIIHDKFEFGDVEGAFTKSDKVIKERFKIHRYASTPLENYVVNAYYDKVKDELIVYANDQQPGRTVWGVFSTLGIPPERIRLMTPRAGGGFGYKLAIWQYVAIISLLSILTGKPVKWVQTRMESLYGPHRPSGYMDAELALKFDGTMLGLRLRDYQADGNWPLVAGLYSLIKFANMVGCYRIKNLGFEFYSIATNHPPVVQDRGVGKPFMSFVLQRLVDLAAKELKIDVADIRFKNHIQPHEMPYTTPSGEIYESGNYPLVLKKALDAINYQKWRSLQKEMKEQGRYIGIGISEGIEPGTSNLGYYYLSKGGSELPAFMGAGASAIVEIDMKGNIKVKLSSSEIGTGHKTTVAQVVADIFNVEPNNVNVDANFDSSRSFLGYSGTFSNAFQDLDIGAVVKAATELKDKMLRIASRIMGVPKSDLVMENKIIKSKLDESKKMSFEDIAAIAYRRLLLLPPEEEAGLSVHATYMNPYAKPPLRTNFNIQLTHANSAHVCVVEVNPRTGKVSILKYVIIHDAGNLINPKIVEGLARGSTLSGIGGVLYEEFVFDEHGNNLSLTFGEYLKPTATEAPDIEIHEVITPAPSTILGTKAAGEGGAITSLAAVANAIEDALSPFNVKITELPLTPEKIWKLIRGR